MKERRENFLTEEPTVGKKFKPNENNEEQPVKACPMRRKGAPVDEECMACGS